MAQVSSNAIGKPYHDSSGDSGPTMRTSVPAARTRPDHANAAGLADHAALPQLLADAGKPKDL